MSAYHPSSAMRVQRPTSALSFAAKHAIGVAPLAGSVLGVTCAWVGNPTRAKSLRPRRDTKWEGDSKAEVNGS